MAVFVLDRRKRPLMPCSEKRARVLLERGRARVHRLAPFTIRLVDRCAEDSLLQPLRIKLDPGSKVTGIAMVRDGETRRATHVVMLAELQHRVDTTMSWVKRFQRLAPATAISMELVKFDTQAMQNPEIGGVEYQQGTLAGYELREYLLEKWGRKCAYCDATNIPLQVEHIQPKSSGGSNRASNLTLACEPCNMVKGVRPLEEFLAHDPARLKRILAQARAPLRDAAAVNATRWRLFEDLKATGLPVEMGSGGRTKWNRSRLSIPKTHALDAACVGHVDEIVAGDRPTLQIKATGRGAYQRTRLNKYGFPRGYLMRRKQVHGFQTGDLIKAEVPSGKKAGAYIGRVAVRASGSFNIQTPGGVVQGISYRYCHILQRGDGYSIQPVMATIAQTKGEAGHRGRARHAALSLPGMNAGVSRAN